MSVAFYRGQQLGRDDLNIYLDADGVPIDAAEVSYAIVDVTTGMEVVVGPTQRTPAHPSVGEYYASIVIPLDANLGPYRIRWTFRETVGGEINRVVQEFDVADKVVQTPGTAQITACQADLVRRLRILLRDNCVGGEEVVEVDVNGTMVCLSMHELWEILRDECAP